MSLVFVFFTLLLALSAALAVQAVCERLCDEGPRRVSSRVRGAGAGLERLGKSRLANIPIARARYRHIERRLAAAGMSITPDVYWALCVAGALAGGLVGAVFAVLVMPSRAVGVALWGSLASVIAGVALGALVPSMKLNTATRNRRERIEATLPYTLDLLSVVVSAGQTIGQGIRVVSEKSEGPLADEFALASRQINVLGQSPERALGDMAKRVDLAPLSMFCTSVIQAMSSGAPLSVELATQAEEASERYYQKVDEQAATISNKMVFPIVLLMMPSIFIVVLVPMALRLAEQMPGLIPGLG